MSDRQETSPPEGEDASQVSAGVGFALCAYGMWGFFPVFWKFLAHVPSMELLAHRMVWSLGFVLGLMALLRRWSWIKRVRDNPRIALIYLGAAIFIAINWGVYIWAVNHGYVVETALGYFMNPLINVAFGALLLGERARKAQWAAIGFAALGVMYLTWSYGQPPWIALTLAVTFGCYGLFKKKASLPALDGLALETMWLFLPALGFLIYRESVPGVGVWGDVDMMTHALLVSTGVATAVPLLCFAGAIRRLKLTTIGLIQYMAPTIQFMLGVFVYQEPFNTDKLFGFALIWLGLILYTFEGLYRVQSTKKKVRGSMHGVDKTG